MDKADVDKQPSSSPSVFLYLNAACAWVLCSCFILKIWLAEPSARDSVSILLGDHVDAPWVINYASALAYVTAITATLGFAGSAMAAIVTGEFCKGDKKVDTSNDCTCYEKTYVCPFCKDEFKTTYRGFRCPKHPRDGPQPEIKCAFCHR